MHVLYQSTIAILLLGGSVYHGPLGAEAKTPDKDNPPLSPDLTADPGRLCTCSAVLRGGFALAPSTISRHCRRRQQLAGSSAGCRSEPLPSSLC